MSMFEIYISVSVIGGILTLIFSIIAFVFAIKERAEKSTKFSALAALISGIITILSYTNITIPMPTIFPLNNETETYVDSVEVTIKSDKSCFIKTYYTLDGTDPKNGELYKDIIIVSKSTTVCARNKFLWMWSEPVERPYIISEINKEVSSSTKSFLGIAVQQVLKQIEKNNNMEKTFQTQQYPDDYVIIWEDKTFEKLMQECLNKEQITYADVKNILSIEIFDDKIILDKEGEDEKLDYNLIYRKTPNDISLNDLKYFDSLVLLSVFNFQSINCNIFEDESFSNRLRGLYVSVELESNQIEQISKLNNLQSLFIERNNITTSDLETISTIKGLIELALWDDNIMDISSLSNLKQLMFLDLSRNNITNIEALSDLEILETVLLAGNNITDFSPVSHVEIVCRTPEEEINYFNKMYHN